MSKGNMLLGHARGKVGDLVFSRTNGQQVVRARAAVVHNPRTTAQTIQRVILNTVSQAYSNMSAICDHSFEGVQPGSKTMSKFMAANMGILRKKISDAQQSGSSFGDIYSFTPVGSKELMLNNYLISMGTLPTIELAEPTQDEIGKKGAITGLAENTYAAVAETLGLKRGDQLTFITIAMSINGSKRFYFARVILDPRNADGSEAPMSSIFALAGNVALPNARNEGELRILEYTDGRLNFSCTYTGYVAGAIIASRKQDDGSWLRSTTYIKSQLEDESILEGVNLQDALDFSNDNIVLENKRYLNNAGVGSARYHVTYTPRVLSVGINGENFTSPKSYQLEDGVTEFTLNSITTTGLDPEKTYVVKVKSATGTQVGTDIAVTNGSIAQQTISIPNGSNSVTVSLYEADTLVTTFATVSKYVQVGPGGDGGGF